MHLECNVHIYSLNNIGFYMKAITSRPYLLSNNIFKLQLNACPHDDNGSLLQMKSILYLQVNLNYKSITNFMGHNFAIIVVRNFLFIGSYGIDMDVIHLLVLFEHQCCVHYLNTNVICLFILCKHECCVSIHIIYTQKLCT
jgi:hypothetical protein